MALVFCRTACAQDVIVEWAGIKAPPTPALKQIKVNPATTALLLLDFNSQTCNMERRPKIKGQHTGLILHSFEHSFFPAEAGALFNTKAC
jgi:hypothetical protein